MTPQHRLGGVLLLSVVLPFQLALSAAESPSTNRLEELRKFKLEDLLVTSLSKKTEKQFEAPAAIAVITNDEIRRSGVRTLADALRLAPGMEVGRINGHEWAISARGFNGRLANKLLVLIDGRVVYSPVFSGVYWDAQDTLLEDIDRIEVIRGPGGTLWGANAVNGVINIITRDANETTGGLLTGGYGSEIRGFGGARYGQQVGESGYFRGYVKYHDFDDFTVGGRSAHDGFDRLSGGFRSDWHPENNHVTLQGDYYYGQRDETYRFATFAPPYAQTVRADTRLEGGNALFRWTHLFPDETDLQFQAYYDYWSASPSPKEGGRYAVDTFDLDFQHRVRLPLRQELVYGFGYRYLPDRTDNRNPNVRLTPAQRHAQLFTAFLHDEIQIVEDRFSLILGSKFEHNDYTGFEIQPNARLVWTPSEEQTVWAAISRAVRTPSRIENDLSIDLVTPNGFIFPRAFGDSSVESETLVSYEVGYRVKPFERLSLDLAAHYDFYDELITGQVGTPFLELAPPPPHWVLPITAANLGETETYGFEAASEYEVLDWWRLRAGYNYLAFRHPRGTAPEIEASPRNQFFVRSSMDLPHDVEVDLWLRYRSEVKVFELAAFADLDVRVAWRPTSSLEIAVVGQNLFHSRRRDYAGSLEFVSELQRGVYGQLTYRF